jgi:hypothetical protein
VRWADLISSVMQFVLPVRVWLGREKYVRRFTGDKTTTKNSFLLLARQRVGYDEYSHSALPDSEHGKPGDG